ncbi:MULTISPECIES: hypothetical protein [unclassified Bradyrhizobium]|uniref:DUF7768 domain-containing protein n=1 Tax=unclassified Bradyrhizobium TaxID=2631580 RepID=UPI0028EE7D18|nr:MULTISPECIES: hypothetical protein [unclassified Bradyrhizobium]
MSLTSPMPIVFTAQSKAYFYCRDAVCEFVFSNGGVPLNPFRVFEYFLGDRVPRDLVRQGNNNLIRVCDELWVFGHLIADGVLFEIKYAQSLAKPIRFFTIENKAREIREISLLDLKFEPEIHSAGVTKEQLFAQISEYQSSHPSKDVREKQLSFIDQFER